MSKPIRITSTGWFVLILALLASQQAIAVKVYQWTDEEGVVHYSDTPPPQEEAPPAVNEMVLFDYPENDKYADEYSIVNQLERMTAWRRQAEEDRRAWKQLQLEEQRLAQEQQSYQQTADTSADIYYPLAYYPYAYYPRIYKHSYLRNFPRYSKRHGRHDRGFNARHFDMDKRADRVHFIANF